MTTTPVVERVARAICEHMPAYLPNEERALKAARAAIAAMQSSRKIDFRRIYKEMGRFTRKRAALGKTK